MTVLAWSVLSLSAAGAAQGAQQPAATICRLVLQQEQVERDDLNLGLQLALTQVQAAERIHTLVEGLWKKDAIQRIVYLRAKHDRETAVIDHDRARLLLERQEAALEQYRLVCGAYSGDGTMSEPARRAASEAIRRYRSADCDVLAADERRAGADLSFFEEVLLSARDLRASDVGTEQDVILAERDVEMARKRQEDTRARVTRCRTETSDTRPQ